MSATAPAVAIEHVTKNFGATRAVDDVSLTIPGGSFFAFLGPSGCGKTTLMRLIAGFETLDTGTIRIDAIDMARVEPEHRPVNMMFQSYALFPHMNVADNIGYGLRRAGLSRDRVADGVEAMLRLVQLQGLGARKPDQLSGGQRQRVALARALARKPRILLLDEPMAALDRKLREETQFALKDIQRELGTTFLVVTHDQDEAMGLADTIALMREGRIEQIGAPHDLYARPATKFAARFIGETNVLEGKVLAIGDDGVVVDTADGAVIAPMRAGLAIAVQVSIGTQVAVAIRPEVFAFGDSVSDGKTPAACFTGTIHDLTFRGASTLVRMALPSGVLLRVAMPNTTRDRMTPGAALTVQASARDVWLLDA